MKRYRVVFTETVNQKIDSQVTYLLEQSGSPETITAWLNKLLDAIDTLGYGPLRFPIAQEETARKDFEVRKFIFGKYLIYYRVHEGRHVVEVLSFRHGAQDSAGQDW